MLRCVGKFQSVPFRLIKYPFSRIHWKRRFAPISIPFCFRIFARSPTRIDVFAVVIAFPSTACGFISSICFLFSSILLCATIKAFAKSSSSLMFSCPAIYPPCFRIAGRTSLVTQCLNLLADSSLLPKISAYNPDSLMTIAPLLLISEVVDVHPPNALLGKCFLSSSATFTLIACFVSTYPNATVTSLPTNHGSLLIVTVRTSPNSSLLKICNSFIFLTSMYCKRRRFLPAL